MQPSQGRSRSIQTISAIREIERAKHLQVAPQLVLLIRQRRSRDNVGPVKENFPALE
ncbi:MAG: hypothetical protein ACOYOZ_11930 [Pirellula sp.]